MKTVVNVTPPELEAPPIESTARPEEIRAFLADLARYRGAVATLGARIAPDSEIAMLRQGIDSILDAADLMAAITAEWLAQLDNSERNPDTYSTEAYSQAWHQFSMAIPAYTMVSMLGFVLRILWKRTESEERGDAGGGQAGGGENPALGSEALA